MTLSYWCHFSSLIFDKIAELWSTPIVIGTKYSKPFSAPHAHPPLYRTRLEWTKFWWAPPRGHRRGWGVSSAYWPWYISQKSLICALNNVLTSRVFSFPSSFFSFFTNMSLDFAGDDGDGNDDARYTIVLQQIARYSFTIFVNFSALFHVCDCVSFSLRVCLVLSAGIAANKNDW